MDNVNGNSQSSAHFLLISKALRRLRNLAADSRFYSLKGISWLIRYVGYNIRVRMSKKGRGNASTGKSIEVVLCATPKHIVDQPPSGIAYIKSILTFHGYSARCIDFNIRLYHEATDKSIFNTTDRTVFFNENSFDQFCREGYTKTMDRWIDEICGMQPQYIAFSISTYATLWTVRYMSKRCKERLPGAKIIFGGPCCKDFKEKLVSDYGADFAIIGSGEKTIVDLLDALKTNHELNTIPGIIYRKDGQVICNPGEYNQEHLDDLPFPDFEDFDLASYSNKGLISGRCSLMVRGSIGCTRNCTFCTYKHYANSYHSRSALNMFKEIQFLKRTLGVTSFTFSDAMINADSLFLDELCNLIISEKESFFWSALFGFKEDVDLAVIKKMSLAGCKKVVLGLESGSEQVRKDMLKPCKDERVREILRAFHSARIQCRVNVMVGYPTETEADFAKTISLIRDCQKYIHDVKVFICYILPGSILFKKAKNQDTFKTSLSSNEGWFFHDEADSGGWTYMGNSPSVRKQRFDQMITLTSQLGLNKYQRE